MKSILAGLYILMASATAAGTLQDLYPQAEYTNAWSNYEYALGDGADAACSYINSSGQEHLSLYEFAGLDGLPADSLITGCWIEIYGYGWEPNAAKRDISIYLSNDYGSTVLGTAKTAADTYILPWSGCAAAGDTVYVVGSSSDMWSMTDSSVSAWFTEAGTFTVVIYDNDATANHIGIDAVYLNFSYTSSGGAGGGDVSFTRRRKIAGD